MPVGFIPLKEFLEKVHLHLVGSKQWEYKNGLVFKTDIYNVTLHGLRDIQPLLPNKSSLDAWF